MIDPYLIPGQPCYVWGNYYMKKYGQRAIYYFHSIVYRMPYFCSQYNDLEKNDPIYFEYYLPIGTEWDPGTFPDWAFCSTVNAVGIIELWSCGPTLLVNKSDTGAWTSIANSGVMEAGLCPDLSRWQGDAWKTSIRMRPAWAEVKE